MYRKLLLSALLLVLSACSDESPPVAKQAKENNQSNVVRKMDFTQISRGGRLFQQNCAACHGEQAQGLAKDWRKADKDGKLPAPPLNGTAHAWHHPHNVLVSVIKNGTVKIGGSMPAWKDSLSDEEINDIIAWFQSKWSDEIYSAWYERDQQSR
jgi:mono/diheme cytochrome c family protein